MLVEEERRVCRAVEDCRKDGKGTEVLTNLIALGIISTKKYAFLVENEDTSDEDAQKIFVRQYKKRELEVALASSDALVKGFAKTLEDVSLEKLVVTLNSVLDKREGQTSPNQFVDLLKATLDEREGQTSPDQFVTMLNNALDERDKRTGRTLFLGTAGSLISYIIVSLISILIAVAAVGGFS